MAEKSVQSILVMGDSIAKGVVFHSEKKRYVFLKDGFIKKLKSIIRPIVHDCSKFGTTSAYGRKLLSEKLTDIIRNNDIKSVTVVRMEVPCCGGLEHAAKTALQQSGKFIPWQVVTVSVDGKILD